MKAGIPKRGSRSSLGVQVLALLAAYVLIISPVGNAVGKPTFFLRYKLNLIRLRTVDDDAASGRLLWSTLTRRSVGQAAAPVREGQPAVVIVSTDVISGVLIDTGPLLLYGRCAYALLYDYSCSRTEVARNVWTNKDPSWGSVLALRAAAYTAKHGDVLVWLHEHTFVGNWTVPLLHEWEALGSPDIAFTLNHPADAVASGTTRTQREGRFPAVGGRIIVRNSPATAALLDELLEPGPWDRVAPFERGALWDAYQRHLRSEPPSQGQMLQSAVRWVAQQALCADTNCSHIFTKGKSALDFSGQPFPTEEERSRLNSVAYSSVLALPHPLAPVVVSGSDHTHGWAAVQLLDTIHATNPGLGVIFWDFGLTHEQRAYVRAHPALVQPIRSFPFDKYPPHFNISVDAGQYAWKPAAIAAVLVDHPLVLWLDAGCIVTGPLTPAWKVILEDGMMSMDSSGTVAQYTHEGTRKFYADIGDWSKMLGQYSHQFNGAVVGVYAQSPEYRTIFLPWLRCALEVACIAPPGSSRANHRQDQAALSVLMYSNRKSFGLLRLFPFETHHDKRTPPDRPAPPPLPSVQEADVKVALPERSVTLDLSAQHLPTVVSLVWLPSRPCLDPANTLTGAAGGTAQGGESLSYSALLAREASIDAAVNLLRNIRNPAVVFVLSEDAALAHAGAAELRERAQSISIFSTAKTIIALSLASPALRQFFTGTGCFLTEVTVQAASRLLQRLSAHLMDAALRWALFATTHYVWVAPSAVQTASNEVTIPSTTSQIYSQLHVRGLVVLVQSLDVPLLSRALLPSVWAASKDGVSWLLSPWEASAPNADLTFASLLRRHPRICLQSLWSVSGQHDSGASRTDVLSPFSYLELLTVE